MRTLEMVPLEVRLLRRAYSARWGHSVRTLEVVPLEARSLAPAGGGRILCPMGQLLTCLGFTQDHALTIRPIPL